ncbi:MAG: FtsX-like permease family protein [Planctomycetes bacterium]|nr:FtsX-like permease family protein [Planctomycetota bacterium]
MSQGQAPKNVQARIGKQVMLPWSKAIEIALKSIRVRFWRSMITMSSIILAIAFLMSIWTSTAIRAALDTGPQARIDAIAAKRADIRATLEKAQGAHTKAQLEELYASDLAAARRTKERAIRENERPLASATTDEAKKLKKTIEALSAELAPDRSLELLRNYLNDERQRIEAVKGKLDPILLQERGGHEAEAKEHPAPKGKDAAPPAKAAGGPLSSFLGYMTPTDKWLAILALLVCFVGIVNAMFMTVQERFREIGTMKCLGALDAFIVKIFLIESAILGFIGTLFGVAIGLILSVGRQTYHYGWPTLDYFPPGSVLTAALSAAVIGLVLSVLAAIFPARKAARMEPVAAMRIEE